MSTVFAVFAVFADVYFSRVLKHLQPIYFLNSTW